jgi:hypothetical protein
MTMAVLLVGYAVAIAIVFSRSANLNQSTAKPME